MGEEGGGPGVGRFPCEGTERGRRVPPPPHPHPAPTPRPPRLIVQHHALVRVLHQLVHRQGGVVRLHHGVRHLWGGRGERMGWVAVRRPAAPRSARAPACNCGFGPCAPTTSWVRVAWRRYCGSWQAAAKVHAGQAATQTRASPTNAHLEFGRKGRGERRRRRRRQEQQAGAGGGSSRQEVRAAAAFVIL